jgi:hypothetical protein
MRAIGVLLGAQKRFWWTVKLATRGASDGQDTRN